MKLFENVESLGDRTIFRTESTFDYIEGSGRPEMIRVKNLLEDWFAGYCDKKKEKLRRRLRGEKQNGKKHKFSLRQSMFNEAFFELYIYVLLRQLGCRVVIEPKLKNTEGKKTRPDFLAKHEATEYTFYVEATSKAKRKPKKKTSSWTR